MTGLIQSHNYDLPGDVSANLTWYNDETTRTAEGGLTLPDLNNVLPD